MNKFLTIARLTRDPESRALQSGSTVATFGIAISDRKKNAVTGEWEDDPIWFDCEAWNGTGEFICNHITKGDPVVLEGRIKLETWTDKATEQKRSKHKFVVERAEFVPKTRDKTGGVGEGQGDDEPAPSPAKTAPPRPRNKPTTRPQQDPIDTGEIPFGFLIAAGSLFALVSPWLT